MRWLGLHLMLVVLVGCDGVFGLVHVQSTEQTPIDGGADAPVDAPADAASRDALDAFVDIGCPSKYSITTAYGTFRFVTQPATWIDAQNDCLDDTPPGNSKHTHLAVASSDAELTSFEVDVAGSSGDLWIGLSDRVTPNVFKWVTDEPLAYPPVMGSPWDTGQPSGGTGEDCIVELGQQRALDDVSCGVTHAYACECDVYVDTLPANY